ncbi:sugar transferase [Dietzia sp. Die43]|uniref:sugar transferase n=1 Tax=Dietzia sp. Die43 TaxID=2926011 RepID=UPI0021176274|nr:sugar transferase [Dietzia sp. Die43]
MGSYEESGKRIFDVVAASIAVAVLSPVLAAVGAAIKLEDRGPALFVQERTGRDGASFAIYKFRSMQVGTASVPSGEIIAPSVTKVGKVIRRTNLDELPQLFNIVKGDMSVVGPRPPLPSQTDIIRARYLSGALRLSPGLTGWAQVNSFDGMDALEKARYDEEYANSISFRLDLGIILRTFVYLLKPPPKY